MLGEEEDDRVAELAAAAKVEVGVLAHGSRRACVHTEVFAAHRSLTNVSVHIDVEAEGRPACGSISPPRQVRGHGECDHTNAAAHLKFEIARDQVIIRSAGHKTVCLTRHPAKS